MKPTGVLVSSYTKGKAVKPTGVKQPVTAAISTAKQKPSNSKASHGQTPNRATGACSTSGSASSLRSQSLFNNRDDLGALQLNDENAPQVCTSGRFICAVSAIYF